MFKDKFNFKKILSVFKRKYKIPHIVSIYFGVPGSGKTTFAAWLVKKDLKHGGQVWSNVPITGAYQLEPKDDIGKYMISDGRVIIDEAGIEYNNRDFKEFSKNSLYFYKYHRHYEVAVDVFSQSYNDMDKKLRDLAQRLYVVRRSLIPGFVYRRRIRKKIGINEYTREIIDDYEFVPFSRRYIYCPPLWKMFNTLSRKNYPEKVWRKW